MSNDENTVKSIIYNKLKKTLDITFYDDYIASISAELLRVESPSAEVQGHSSKNKNTPLRFTEIIFSKVFTSTL